MDIYILCDYETFDPVMVGPKRRRVLANFENGQIHIFARQLINGIWADFDSDHKAISVESEIFTELNKSLLKVKNERVTANSFKSLKLDFTKRLDRLFSKTKNSLLRNARIIDSPLVADY